jgi:excinuclease ABC subunit C
MTVSVLDEVPGLGPARKKAILSHFGSVKKLRAATPEEIAQVSGVGPALSASVYARFHAREGQNGAVEEPPAINYATGEILES